MKKNNAEKYKKNIKRKRKERKKKSTIKGKGVTKNSPNVIRTLDLRVFGSV